MEKKMCSKREFSNGEKSTGFGMELRLPYHIMEYRILN
ncbi:hypothetical protein UNH65_15555 [Chitinophaga sp. 180180018-2]|nr:hypothetical protein [Chitinophaga sp. 212800010-3]